MTELERKIDDIRRQGKKGISFFLTAGYPNMRDFINTVKYIDRNRLADFLEIGVPFSDPIADGPIIQLSSPSI